MGYMKNIRKYVGHQPVFMAAAGALVINEKNQLLLEKRKDNGYWAYPGGTMELGETFEECAMREVLEETGLILKDMKFFCVASGEKRHVVYPNKDEVYIVEVVYLCHKYEGSLKAQKEEITKLDFFDLDGMPKNISPVNMDIIKEYIHIFGEGNSLSDIVQE